MTDKKWKEKDKKALLDRVRDRFFLLRRLKINIIKLDPNKKRKRKGASRNRNINKRKKLTENGDGKVLNE